MKSALYKQKSFIDNSGQEKFLDQDDQPEYIMNMNRDQILEWYTIGVEKLDEETRIENILHRLMNIDIYMREFLGVDLKNMKAIRYHKDNVIPVGESSSES